MKLRLLLSFYDIFAEHDKVLNTLTGVLLSSADSLQKQQDDVLKSIEVLSTSFDAYIHSQTEDAKAVLEQKSVFDVVFSRLQDTAESFNDTLADKTQKLNKLKMTIEYCAEGETLLEEANRSFLEAYRSFNYGAYGQIQIIINKLNMCANSIQGIQRVPRPYSDMISLYTGKIEEVLKEINDSKLMSFVKLLQVQSTQTRKKRKKFCNVCGTRIEPAFNFCPKCETSVSAETS
jgi:hypothetical protein